MGAAKPERYAWSDLPAPGRTRRCPAADRFAAWTAALLAQASQQPSQASVDRALLHLQARFWDYHRDLPGQHKQRMGARGHSCVFQVYEEAYAALRELQLALLPAGGASPGLGARWVFLGEGVSELDE